MSSGMLRRDISCRFIIIIIIQRHHAQYHYFTNVKFNCMAYTAMVFITM